MSRHNNNTANKAYTNDNNNNASARSTASVTAKTYQQTNSRNRSNNNTDSISSGCSYASAITIVDEDESAPTTPSIDDLLGDLQSLSIQQKQKTSSSTSSYEKQQRLEAKTLNQEVRKLGSVWYINKLCKHSFLITKKIILFQYLAAKRAALKKVQVKNSKKKNSIANGGSH